MTKTTPCMKTLLTGLLICSLVTICMFFVGTTKAGFFAFLTATFILFSYIVGMWVGQMTKTVDGLRDKLAIHYAECSKIYKLGWDSHHRELTKPLLEAIQQAIDTFEGTDKNKEIVAILQSTLDKYNE